ncbi:putative reverse transcriptase domain-containing protein [Tanacetum coccineum]|uniref:Reverse transcriptase domain-containing protein n=1 Tax=Tanacetum coccineum TaxID=301880 RepID=A0ABQ5CE27_9ASTR
MLPMFSLVYIMPLRMTTQSASQLAAASRGGGTGGRAGRGGGRTRGCFGDQGDGRIDGQGGQVGGQGSEVNDGVDGVPDFSTIIAQQLQNLLPTIGDVRNVMKNNDRRGCTYKEFLACNLKEYDGKGGAVVYTRWIEKMESVLDMSGCRDNQKVKYTAGSFVGKALTWLNSQIRTLGREVEVGMSWDNFKIAGTLTDEAYRNGSIKKNLEKRGNGGEPSKDKNGRDDNNRSRTRNAFATTTNPVRRENMGAVPKCTTCNFDHSPETPCRTCFNYNHQGNFAKDCRVVPRNVNPINARNPTARACYECGSTDHVKAACPRLNQAQRPGGNHQNQVVAVNGGQGRGKNGMIPIDLGFSYEIEIASGQLVEIDKVIKGCKLEIEGHVFDINLIPFGSGSFDVIISMDWLSNHKAEIICHEKVARIPLSDGEVLRFIGERPDKKVRHLLSAKAKEQKREELVVVRYFLEVFPDDLSGLPPSRAIEFRIELVPEEIPVAKSPY